MIEVYHNNEVMAYWIAPTFEVLSIGHFECVAHVDTDNLEEAYRLTQNLDAPWSLNAGVKAFGNTEVGNLFKKGSTNRSTSIGDLIKVNGKFFLVDLCGFTELTREQECKLTFFAREAIT